MKETFILRTDWADSIFELTNEGQATILRNLFRYHIDSDDELELDTQEVRIVWKLIRKNLDLNIENYEKRREINKANGSKGGRPKANESENNPIGFSGITEKANVTLSVTDTVIDTDTVLVTDIVIDTERKKEANFSDENSDTIFFDENGIEIKPNNQPTETRGDVAPRTKNLVGLSDDSLKFLEWFKSQFDTKGITWTENATKEARRGYDKSIQRLKAMPDNEGLSDNELKGLIAKIIIFIKSDKFWSTAFISPAKLLKSNREGINYFELFVNEYRQKSPELAKQRRDAETDRLIRNDEAQRERMKHEESQF